MRPDIPSASGNVPDSTGRQRPSRQRSQSGSRQTPSVALVPAGSAPSTSRPAYRPAARIRVARRVVSLRCRSPGHRRRPAGQSAGAGQLQVFRAHTVRSPSAVAMGRARRVVRHGRRPARQPDLPAEQRVDRHRPAFRSVLVIPRRGRRPARLRLQGDGAEEQPLADVRRADARSRQIGRRDGVRCRFQLSRQSVEPRPASRVLSRSREPRRQRVRALPRSRPARRRRAPGGRLRRAAGRPGRGGGHRPVPCAARPG